MTPKIEKILVALGFSDYARQTFDYAATIAEAMGAELVIGSVVNDKDVEAVSTISSMGYEVDGAHYVDGIKKTRRETLERILESSPYTHERIRLVFKVGHPVEKLLQMIVEEKADMVVMGVKGRSDLESVLVGSVAEKIFRKSPVPVVSYRDAKSAERLRRRIRID